MPRISAGRACKASKTQEFTTETGGRWVRGPRILCCGAFCPEVIRGGSFLGAAWESAAIHLL